MSMTKCLILLILPISLLLTHPVISQNSNKKLIESELSKDIKDLSKIKDTEQAIKRSFKILSFEKELSYNVSLSIYNSLAENLFKIGDFDNALNYAKRKTFMTKKVDPVQKSVSELKDNHINNLI